MGAGSETGRRSLAIAAVCCAICGLVLAASAMPMLATESPAGGLFDEPNERDPADGPGASGDAGAGAEFGFGYDVSIALAAYADDLDHPITDGILYGLAALFSFVDGDSSGAPALGAADVDPDPNGDVESRGDLAGSALDGEFGDLLEPSVEDGEYEEPDDDEFDDLESGGVDEYPNDGGSGPVDGDVDNDAGSDTADGTWDDDGSTGSGDASVSDDEDSNVGDDSGDGDGTGDGDDQEGGRTDDSAGENGDSDDSSTADEPGGDGEWDDETGDSAAGGDGGRGDDADGSNDDVSDHDDGTEPADEHDDRTDGAAEHDDAARATEDGSGDESGNDEAGSGDEDGSDESGLEESVPGLSDRAVTAALLAFAALVGAYVFYARDDPIGYLLAIPGRLVSLALITLVACSQALERAVAALGELRSVAELPGLAMATLGGLVRSAETRIRTAASSLSPFSSGDAAADEGADARVTARDRVRLAFETVIDASTMYRGRVATATPADVARSARDAGAPAEPVETITDSFRDVEYGERDPEPYLERTTAAHDRLRAALEAARAAGSGDDADADPATVDPAPTDPTDGGGGDE